MDESLRVESDPGLNDSSLVEDTSDRSSLASDGRGGLIGDSTDESDTTGILIECAGRLRPLEAPAIPRPGREGLDNNGTRFLGLSLKDEKQLGAVLILSARDLSSGLPTLTTGGCAHDLLR